MSNWKDIVRTISPTIGTALGGPMGGMAIKFLAEQFLGDSEASEISVEKAIIGAAPEQLIKIKELDIKFKTDMQKLGIDVFKLEVEDRKSARSLFSINIWPQIVLSAIFVIGYFVILFLLISNGSALAALSPQLLGVFTTVLGVLTASIPQILGFWFGSSLGSKEKNKNKLDEKG